MRSGLGVRPVSRAASRSRLAAHLRADGWACFHCALTICASGSSLIRSSIARPAAAASRACASSSPAAGGGPCAVDENAWRYAPLLYEAALAAAGAIGFVGLAIAFRGLTYRRKVKLKCKKCKTAMLTEPIGFGFRCAAGHPAGTAVSKVLLLILSLVSAAALGALTVLASLS